jgi:acyl-CoA dehydrogenase
MNEYEAVADLVAMMDSLFGEHHATTEPVAHDLDRALWTKLEAVGLARLTGSEESGGSGAGWREAAALLTVAASHAAAVPLVEHDLLAGWVLERAGVTRPRDGVFTAAVLDQAGFAGEVPWAGHTDHLAILYHAGDQWLVDVLATADADITPGANLLGHPTANVRVDLTRARGSEVSQETSTQFLLRAALARSLQMCATMEHILLLTTQHLSDRVQFGRTLSKFQALQHLVSDMAAEVTLSWAATNAALSEAIATEFTSPTLGLAVATARSCVGHAATVVVRGAHQAHGAIGTTMEHQLHRFTNPVLAWRSEYGSVAYWDGLLAQAAGAAGRDRAWDLVTDGVELGLLLPS